MSEPRDDGKARIGAPRAVSALLPARTRRALGKHGFSSASLPKYFITMTRQG